MPLETNGWIEYSPYLTLKERNEDHSWLTFMSIDSIVDHTDEITELLFGYSKRIIRQEFEIDSIAKDRGIPTNATELVKSEMERIKAFEKECGDGEIFGYTFIHYDEIRNVTQSIPKDSPWQKLFKLIEVFKKIKGLENEQIRLVVWFAL